MGTAQEIDDAIRALPSSERDELMRDIPSLLPEFADEAWQRISEDERPLPEMKVPQPDFPDGDSSAPLLRCCR